MNTILAVTHWRRVVRLSRFMMNGTQGLSFRKDLVYLADNTVGGAVRLVRCIGQDRLSSPHSSGAVDEVQNPFGGWLGYAERHVAEIQWESGSSGAQIWAYEKDGEWFIKYDGPNPEHGRESQYIHAFLDASEIVMESDICDPERMRQAFVSEAMNRAWRRLGRIGVIKCAYCQRAMRDGVSRDKEDDEGWSREADIHVPDCRWVLTRAGKTGRLSSPTESR